MGPIETDYSGQEGALLSPKTTGEVWDPLRLVILVQITMVCMHKMTGDVWGS